MLIVGTEWLVEATGCDPQALCDADALRAVFGRAVAELDLRVIGDAQWHTFPGAGGVTGLALLTESHLACHTYPEFGVATFNLYCCRARPRWAWEERLAEMLGASGVVVREVARRAQAGPDGDAPLAGDGSDVARLEEGGEESLAAVSEAGGRAR